MNYRKLWYNLKDLLVDKRSIYMEQSEERKLTTDLLIAMSSMEVEEVKENE